MSQDESRGPAHGCDWGRGTRSTNAWREEDKVTAPEELSGEKGREAAWVLACSLASPSAYFTDSTTFPLTSPPASGDTWPHTLCSAVAATKDPCSTEHTGTLSVE